MLFPRLAPALPALLVCALAGCQPAPYDTNGFALETLDACVAASCTTLDLDGLTLDDYSQINGLSHVTSLMVSYSGFSDLDQIAGMSQLRELHMASAEVRDLSGLAAFPNLELLHIQNTELVSYAPIAGLSGLRELAVGTSTLEDLTFVANMPGLQRLMLTSFGYGMDLSTLGAHPGLRTIELHEVNRLELAPLLAMRNLRTVSLSYLGAELGPAQTQVIAQLRARGVTVDVEEILPPVC